MAFAGCVRRSVSKLASACDRARSISFPAVMNCRPCPSQALNPSPLRAFISRGVFTLSRSDSILLSEIQIRDVIDSKILSDLEIDDLDYLLLSVKTIFFFLILYWEQLKETIPEYFSFRIEDDPSDQFVTLTTKEHVEENFKVLAFMPSLVADKPSIKLILTVTKKSGLGLEFSCTDFGDHFNIDNVSVNHPGEKNDWQFEDLEDDMKKAFNNYVETLLGESTRKLLHRYMMSKRKREYLAWLKDVKKFIR
ncbi:PREDICTED: uncharacterized protein At2g39790, mitochondrial-like [Camelina sativa]|uniref:Uncharacterized protein At2g39790, mitochondrial-like n=1 Tax=Camelina sativa TaxID=90675 RepID=A0ABM0YXV6_CAMSA|nr:PREDICTED: uncharacterized protein At2g39790, mitochondrial-like [Camelina sativa]